MRGKGVNSRAIEWLLKHPNALTWPNLSIATELKRVGIYSSKTYIKDIRIDRIIREALLKISVNEQEK